jgi:hypothetical protein
MHDKVQLLRRLRWGDVGFANLRHKGFEVRPQITRAATVLECSTFNMCVVETPACAFFGGYPELAGAQPRLVLTGLGLWQCS